LPGFPFMREIGSRKKIAPVFWFILYWWQ